MVTYFYWIVLIFLCGLVFFLLFRSNQNKIAMMASLLFLMVGSGAYFFHFQQIFVKHYGGVMTLSVPKGQHHLGATWKDDNLWIQNYDPVKNICYFNEYSRGNLLQGKVVIENCNPLMP